MEWLFYSSISVTFFCLLVFIAWISGGQCDLWSNRESLSKLGVDFLVGRLAFGASVGGLCSFDWCSQFFLTAVVYIFSSNWCGLCLGHKVCQSLGERLATGKKMRWEDLKVRMGLRGTKYKRWCSLADRQVIQPLVNWQTLHLSRGIPPEWRAEPINGADVEKGEGSHFYLWLNNTPLLI